MWTSNTAIKGHTCVKVRVFDIFGCTLTAEGLKRLTQYQKEGPHPQSPRDLFPPIKPADRLKIPLSHLIRVFHRVSLLPLSPVLVGNNKSERSFRQPKSPNQQPPTTRITEQAHYYQCNCCTTPERLGSLDYIAPRLRALTYTVLDETVLSVHITY